MERKLDNWKSKLLSLGRKVTLLNTVLSSTQLHHMFFVLPKWVRDKFDRIRKRFLWARVG